MDMMGQRQNSDGSSQFLMGLVAGTAVGVGLGILFAPKAGVELRGQISDQVDALADTASEGLKRASSTANTLVDKGRDAIERGREAYNKAEDAAGNAVRSVTSPSRT
jgi:gas vesicle protein